MRNLWLFRRYLWDYKRKLILLMGIILLSAMLEGMGIGLFFPLIEYIQKGEDFLSDKRFKLLFDGMNYVGITPKISNFIVVIFLVIVCTLAIKYLIQVVSALTYNPLMKQIRDDGFKRIINFPMKYFNSVSSGKIVSTLINEVDYVGHSITYLITVVTSAISLIVYTSFAVLISLKLTLLVIVIALIRYKILGFFIKEARVLGERNTNIRAFLNSYLTGIYQGIDVIKSYGTEEREFKRFKQRTSDFLSTVNKSVYNQASSSFFENLLGEGLFCFILYLSIAYLNIPATSLLVFLFIVFRIIPKVTAINDARIRIAEYTAGIVYLKTVLSNDTEPAQYRSTVTKLDFNRDIIFKSVNFSYNSNENFILNDINLTILKKEKIAIVGISGAGKTTCIRLLLRLYNPTSGCITIDGINIADIHRDSWKKLISVVSQDTFIFDDTVESNIKYSVENCSNEEFWAAVRHARADEFIDKLPNREKTELGERGIRLSGGQRQRIAIARAFLRNSPILILDEATSALDSITENLIQQALEELSQNRTMIIIAHRLSTIKSVDRIIVLDKGRVAEVGTHAELLENKYLYKKYHSIQIY